MQGNAKQWYAKQHNTKVMQYNTIKYECIAQVSYKNAPQPPPLTHQRRQDR